MRQRFFTAPSCPPIGHLTEGLAATYDAMAELDGDRSYANELPKCGFALAQRPRPQILALESRVEADVGRAGCGLEKAICRRDPQTRDQAAVPRPLRLLLCGGPTSRNRLQPF